MKKNRISQQEKLEEDDRYTYDSRNFKISAELSKTIYKESLFYFRKISSIDGKKNTAVSYSAAKY